MDAYFNFNGKIIKAGTAIISPDNRGFRYGDGVFETMKINKGEILLKAHHFDRLFSGLAAIKIDLPAVFTKHYVEEQIILTCNKNKISGLARVRLTVFRGDGGLYELSGKGGGFIIQAWELAESSLNKNGLVIGIYNDARKSCDRFSGLKSNNYLTYAMAAMYAKQQKYNDCLVLNTYDRVCDASIANVFWIKEGRLFTPPLSEGCVAGVMRRYMIDKLRESGYEFLEKNASVAELKDADEVFLTNAIHGIRWVAEIADIRVSYNNIDNSGLMNDPDTTNRLYVNDITATLYTRFIG